MERVFLYIFLICFNCFISKDISSNSTKDKEGEMNINILRYGQKSQALQKSQISIIVNDYNKFFFNKFRYISSFTMMGVGCRITKALSINNIKNYLQVYCTQIFLDRQNGKICFLNYGKYFFYKCKYMSFGYGQLFLSNMRSSMFAISIGAAIEMMLINVHSGEIIRFNSVCKFNNNYYGGLNMLFFARFLTLEVIQFDILFRVSPYLFSFSEYDFCGHYFEILWTFSFEHLLKNIRQQSDYKYYINRAACYNLPLSIVGMIYVFS